MSMAPKVSVIVPVYNVEKYLKECLESVISQTLTDIEIICVNDGSTDKSPEILQFYAGQDNRIQIITQDNSGYGRAVNTGLNAAKGEYIGIVESDDYIKSEMYEELYYIAHKHALDIIKGDFFYVYGDMEKTIIPTKQTEDSARYNRIFTPLEELWSFYLPVMNPIGIFRKDWLDANLIRLNETPGATHQDMGFWFQTLVLARRFMILDRYYYMYRQDNPTSSLNQHDKVFCVRDEFSFIFDFVQGLENKEALYPLFYHHLFINYLHSYNRLPHQYRRIFLDNLKNEFKKAQEEGLLDTQLFSSDDLLKLHTIMTNPVVYL